MVGIGLLGCGTMGTELADAVAGGAVRGGRICTVYDQDATLAQSLAGRLPDGATVSETIDQLIQAPGVTAIVECASQSAVREHGEHILSSGLDLLMISSGALVDPHLFRSMVDAANKTGRQLIVPSGALGGIDTLRSARGHIDEVTLVSTKRPEAFAGAPGFARWEGQQICEPTVLYEGAAAQAVTLFPANVNVAATVSLAALGPDRTQVRVIADPAAPGNVHEVRAKGQFGEASFRLVNRPHNRNPKTSHLAVLSAIETLRAFCEPGPRIGT